VDWYGNARPLFVRGRIIALLGYELVEGSRHGDHVTEIRRVSLRPTVVRWPPQLQSKMLCRISKSRRLGTA